MKKLYLPFTRMNLVVSLDDGLIAPPSYIATRKFHEDFTLAFPRHLLAFDIPSCPIKPESWTDEKNEADLIRIREIDDMLLGEEELAASRQNALTDEKSAITDKHLHFPLILEVEANEHTVEAIHPIPSGDSSDSANGDRKEIELPETLLLSKALPAHSISRILTPGPNTAKELSDDPFLKSVDWDFEIVGIENFPIFLELPKVEKSDIDNADSPYGGKGIDLGQLNRASDLCGVASLLAASTQCQDWSEGENHSFIASLCVYLTLGKFGLAAYEETEFPDLAKHDYFCPSDQSSREDFLNLGTLLSNLATDEKGRKDRDGVKSDESSSLEILDNEVFLETCKLCHKENTKSSSPVEILKQVVESLAKSSKNSEHVEKYRKVLIYVEKIYKGNGELIQLFSAKTEGFHAARSAMLFLLNPSPDGILQWAGENKPEGARISDYFRAAILIGLYHGFSGISPKWKRAWRKAFSLSLEADDLELANDTSKWQIEGSKVSGELKTIFGIRKTAVGKTFTLTFGLSQDTALFVESFKSQIAEIKAKNPLDEALTELLETLAEFNGLGKEFQNDVYDVSKIHDLVEIVRKGYLHVPKSLLLGNNPVSWIHEKVLQELKNSPQIDLNPEAILQICRLCGFSVPREFL
jgi:hypothetical protein